MSAPPTAITIDPSGFFRAGLDSCLVQAGFRVVSHAPGLAVAVHALDGRTPHLAAVGPNFTEPEAFAVCRRMLARWPEVNILLYTGHAADPLVLADAFHTGIEAVLPREAGTAETLVVIEALLSGQTVFAEETRRASPVSLSKREVDVLRLMAEGRTDREIARALNVSYVTARNHAQRILEKLDVHERREAVRRGRRLGWLPLKN